MIHPSAKDAHTGICSLIDFIRERLGETMTQQEIDLVMENSKVNNGCNAQ